MASKLMFLTENSFKRKAKSKWFIIANVILAIIICLLMNIDSVINFFGGDFNENTKVYVIDNTNYTFELLNENIKSANKSISDSIDFDLEKTNKTKEKLKEKLKNNELIIEINEDTKNTLDVNLISEGYIDTMDYQILSSALNNTKISIAISKSNIDPNTLNNIYKNLEIKREYLNKDKSSDEENTEMIMTTVFPFIILPFFMLSLFLIQMIGSEINDEKSTRGMEIIISNVSPKTHFFSKVIASNLFVIMQGLLLLLYVGIGFLVRKLIVSPVSNGLDTQIVDIVKNVAGTSFMSKLIYIIPITLVLMLLTFIAYSLLAGILASMTTNQEDFGQLQTPIIIISLIGYYLAMMANMFEGSLFIRILSYIPFISAILSPSLLVLNQVGIIDMIISIIVMIGTIYILIKYGLKIYKVGILNYSSKDLWKKMFKAIKNKA